MQMVLLSRVLLQRVNQELGSMSECPTDSPTTEPTHTQETRKGESKIERAWCLCSFILEGLKVVTHD